MHKDFYASGFLYHPKSQQILLQQKISATKDTLWSLFGKMPIKNKTGEEIIKEIFEKELNIKLNLKKINIIYTYFSKELEKDHAIYYYEVKTLHKIPLAKKSVLGWFTFKQIQKLSISAQTKQDLIVGQRVIDSSVRRDLGEQTIG